MPQWTPERRTLAILNHLDQAVSHLYWMEREAPHAKKVIRELTRHAEIAQQMAGRELAREMSLPSVTASSDGLRSRVIRIASSLPTGDPTRRKLLALLREGRNCPTSPGIKGIDAWTEGVKGVTVPFSELAMHVGIAGLKVDAYAISPDRSAAAVCTSRGYTTGLPGELLGTPRDVVYMLRLQEIQEDHRQRRHAALPWDESQEDADQLANDEFLADIDKKVRGVRVDYRTGKLTVLDPEKAGVEPGTYFEARASAMVPGRTRSGTYSIDVIWPNGDRDGFAYSNEPFGHRKVIDKLNKALEGRLARW